jgi:regulatory protein
VARTIALRQLTGAPRTRAQLREAMARRGVPDEVAEAVLDRFEEVNLVDDTAYAQMWVRSRHSGRGLARRALAQELRHRGVDGDVAAEALEQLDPDEELETARALVARRLSGTRRLDPDARVRRLAGMLARKGYPSGVALRVIREALAAEGISDTADLHEFEG